MTTIIGLNIKGVPVGSNFAKKVVIDNFIEDIINASHKGIPNEKVNKTCDELPKEYGIIPIKLIKRIIIKMGTSIVIIPLIFVSAVWFAWALGASLHL